MDSETAFATSTLIRSLSSRRNFYSSDANPPGNQYRNGNLKAQQKSRESLRFEGSWKSAENAIGKSQCSPGQPKKMDPDQVLR
jgi:hypothetical protein